MTSGNAPITSALYGGGTIVVGWEPGPGEVVGYEFCWGYARGHCTNSAEVGPVAMATVSGLQRGCTYYFAVKAIDAFGRTSLPSAELEYTFPPAQSQSVPTLQAKLATDASALTLCFPGRARTTYQIQATEDFQEWETIYVTHCVADGQVTFKVTDMTSRPRRFFRLSQ